MNKVISGGQTGVDRIGLEVAKSLGIRTGGHCPKGYRTENGPDYSLKDFGLTPTASESYTPRTILNIQDSTGTVLFGDMKSPGSKKTVDMCVKFNKPYVTNPLSGGELALWIDNNDIDVLNIAGNRGSKLDSMKQTIIAEILIDAFSLLGYKL